MIDTSEPPDWLAGAWIRAGRSIADGPPIECSDVVWLQVGPWFADVRVPRPGRVVPHAFDSAHAFSGRLVCLEPCDDGLRVAWDHDLDTDDREGGPDTASLALRDAVLIESGDGYVEWWEHPEVIPDHADVVLASPFVGGAGTWARVVCTAGMAVVVWSGETPGGAWCSAAGGWEPERVVGRAPSDLLVPAALRAALDGDPLPEPWILEVVG